MHGTPPGCHATCKQRWPSGPGRIAADKEVQAGTNNSLKGTPVADHYISGGQTPATEQAAPQNMPSDLAEPAAGSC